MNNDNNLFENVLKSSGGKIDRETLQKATQNRDASELVKNLNDSDKQKLESILSDKEKLAKVLESPQAKMLFKMFGKAASPKSEPSSRAANSNSQQSSGTDWVPRHSAGGKNG